VERPIVLNYISLFIPWSHSFIINDRSIYSSVKLRVMDGIKSIGTSFMKMLYIYNISYVVVLRFRSRCLWNGKKYEQDIGVDKCKASSQWPDGSNKEVTKFWTPLIKKNSSHYAIDTRTMTARCSAIRFRHIAWNTRKWTHRLVDNKRPGVCLRAWIRTR
jgi:hypothetical protein